MRKLRVRKKPDKELAAQLEVTKRNLPRKYRRLLDRQALRLSRRRTELAQNAIKTIQSQPHMIDRICGHCLDEGRGKIPLNAHPIVGCDTWNEVLPMLTDPSINNALQIH